MSLPRLVPVVVLVACNLEHVLGRVFIFRTSSSTIALEIIEQCARVLANVAEVDGLAAFAKEEQSVELLKKNGTRFW